MSEMEVQYLVIGLVGVVLLVALIRAGDAVSNTTLRDATGRAIDPTSLAGDSTDDVQRVKPRRDLRMPAKVLRVTSWFPWHRG
jgi:hypothetical protein